MPSAGFFIYCRFAFMHKFKCSGLTAAYCVLWQPNLHTDTFNNKDVHKFANSLTNVTICTKNVQKMMQLTCTKILPLDLRQWNVVPVCSQFSVLLHKQIFISSAGPQYSVNYA